MQTPAVDPASLRLYYLQQLGISVYVPRGAEPEQTGVEAAPAVADDMPMPVRQASRSPVPTAGVGADHRAVLQQLKAEEPRPPVVAPPPVAVAMPAVTAATQAGSAPLAAPPFQLLFGFCSADLALAVQIPALAKGQVGEMEQRLLANLLRWLGLASPTGWLQFRWPLPGLPAGTMVQAGKSLGVFLQQAASSHSPQHLLVLGQGAAQCLAEAGNESELQCRLWSAPGLTEMLAVPQLKRDAWQALLPLHTVLSTR